MYRVIGENKRVGSNGEIHLKSKLLKECFSIEDAEDWIKTHDVKWDEIIIRDEEGNDV